MGARFELQHANLVGYLTGGPEAVAPRSNGYTLFSFLASLAWDRPLISSTQGTPNDWTQRVAESASRELQDFKFEFTDSLPAHEVARFLDPLRTYFTGYIFYALVIPDERSQQDPDANRFFFEAAITSDSAGLVLMPFQSFEPQLTQFVDPFPALRMLAEFPTPAPAVIFWTPSGGTCVLPLEQARTFYRRDLLPALTSNRHQVDQVIRDQGNRRRSRRLLHLSDLHIGSPEAASRRAWLKQHLGVHLRSVDHVVVTGDLFDSPREDFRSSFDEFRTDVENLTKKELLVIPGNHDVRRKGNAFGPLGRNSEHVTDLRWSPLVVDHELQTVFFSFNSSETGDFARGAVSERQRLNIATLFDQQVNKTPKIENYLRIALVHHHPLSYSSSPTALYEKLLVNLFGSDEQFIAFENAEEFLSWCGARRVSLILHGHRHVPHLTTIEGRGNSLLTVVGCGSTTGAEGKPMCYDVVTMDPDTHQWNVLFYHDERGDGSGFGVQNVAINTRTFAV